jgi:hypothetical protein
VVLRPQDGVDMPVRAVVVAVEPERLPHGVWVMGVLLVAAAW